MSIYFNFKGKSGKELHALNRQWNDLQDFRKSGVNASLDLLKHTGETFGVNKAEKDMSVNMLRVDEMYRLVDGTEQLFAVTEEVINVTAAGTLVLCRAL